MFPANVDLPADMVIAADAPASAQDYEIKAGFDANGNGTATIKRSLWLSTSRASAFFAQRTPFALKRSVSTSTSDREVATTTGGLLRNYYVNFVKPQAEQALQSQSPGAEVTMP